MSGEQRSPAVNNLPTTLGGRDEMIKASIGLQDLRRKIYLKAKSDKAWRRKRHGFGWNRWSKAWFYETLGLFNDYGVRYYKA
jgi:hypothetical protein